MIRLKDRTTRPPYGWAVVHYLTGDARFVVKGQTFDEVVGREMKFRLANPQLNMPGDFESCATWVEAYKVEEMMYNPRCMSWLVDTDTGQEPVARKRPKEEAPADASAHSAGALERLGAGAATIRGWLEGGFASVTPELAYDRAIVCVACPINARGSIRHEFYRGVADQLRKILTKQGKGWTVFDDRLHTCLACDCDLKLKVWFPITLIREYMTPAIERRLDPLCWIPKER